MLYTGSSVETSGHCKWDVLTCPKGGEISEVGVQVLPELINILHISLKFLNNNWHLY